MKHAIEVQAFCLISPKGLWYINPNGELPVVLQTAQDALKRKAGLPREYSDCSCRKVTVRIETID
jgi:hypothetical protein